MKADQLKRALASAELQHDPSGVDELLELVTRLRRAVDASSRGGQSRPRVRYADQADEGERAPRSRPTTGVWGR